MGKPKFTRANLREIIQSGAGLGSSQARELTGRIIGALAATLARGETVELRGLGTFETRKRKPRTAHNPKSMTPVEVPAHTIIIFRPCGKLKKSVSAVPAGNCKPVSGDARQAGH
jgi:nucleoid DNA-binding protein